MRTIMQLTTIGLAIGAFTAPAGRLFAQTDTPPGTERRLNMLYILPGSTVRGTIVATDPLSRDSAGGLDGARIHRYGYSPRCRELGELTVELTRTGGPSGPSPRILLRGLSLEWGWSRIGAAQGAGARAVLHGTIQRANDRFLVVVGLADGGTGAYVVRVTELPVAGQSC